MNWDKKDLVKSYGPDLHLYFSGAFYLIENDSRQWLASIIFPAPYLKEDKNDRFNIEKLDVWFVKKMKQLIKKRENAMTRLYEQYEIAGYEHDQYKKYLEDFNDRFSGISF